jgi:hypothetical protein
MKSYIDQNIKRDFRIRARLRFRNVAKSDLFLYFNHEIQLIHFYALHYPVQIICTNTKPHALLSNVAYFSESSIEMKSPYKTWIGGFGLVQ